MKIPLLFALVGTLCVASWAQDNTTTPSPIPYSAKAILPNESYLIPLRNVPPRLMAYWLDPKNHPLTSEQTPPPTGVSKEQLDSRVFSLPAGITRIMPVDPQNNLLVMGTPEAVEQLKATIALLDRPFRQVEIEAKFISLPTEDIQKLIPNFSDTTAQIWRGNFSSSLGALLGQHKAVVSMAPRVVAINNLMASLSQTLAQPIKITSAKKGDALPNVVEAKDLSLETTQSLDVTPTINNDDTVTLLAHIKRSVQLKNSEPTNSLVLEENPAQEIIANVRDGETFALPQKQTPEQAKTSRRTVLLITTRIVRRPGQP